MNKPTSDASSLDSLQSIGDDELLEQIDRLSREIANQSSDSGSPGMVCKTASEAARVLGVAPATFAKWIDEPGFPGKRGGNNQRSAEWPIDEIKAWRRAKYGTGEDGTQSDLRRRKLLAEIETREAKLRRELGKVIELDAAVSAFAQAVAAARSKLEDIPERIAARIPATRPKLRRRVAEIARREIRLILVELADTTLGMDDEEEADDHHRRANRERSKPERAKKAGRGHGRRMASGRKTATRQVGRKGSAA